ncbi:exodeoxyribonuclease III [Chelatococcus sp. SYSU_G07232]|uniref:Exodeoxyribonuclease III n=1 Tax=Chelatococcus albus TaxID=3047466 RepID=A0ABT7AH53_9HYPH|nr:exodeoxyribonuclease III [Chelatococcus sp. SYSU_G07232]MDJ1158699.1 exodeoxyribonuclease III [Chelatococcus sp. SYSU_G07232]
MQLVVTTWNVNSVRLRLDHVARFVAESKPDVLCLQETKCPDDRFPLSAFRSLGYAHIAINGQKGYHGVAVLSRLPFAETRAMGFCDKNDARHIAVTLGKEAKQAAGITIHNFYVPAGGDIPDPAVNPRFAHKLAFLDELMAWTGRERPAAEPSILVGDLNIAPYETDVWNHKALLGVVSHTPIETSRLEEWRQTAGWVDAVRHLKPEPEPVYTWWSYRSPDWAAANKGRRLDHVWLAPSLQSTLQEAHVTRDTRGWERPSDHAPVTVTLDF